MHKMNLLKKFKNLEQYAKYSVLIIILFSLIVLSLTSIYHVSGDGCWHLPVGKFIASNLRFPLFDPLGRDEPFWSPPLYHMIVAAVYYFFNSINHNAANFAIKFVSPVFGILSLIFSFLVVKKLANSKIAFYSAIFLSFIPIFIDYSVLSYVESTLIFFAILSVYFLLNGKTVLSGIAAGLSILTKYNGIFMLPVLLYILYKKCKDKNSFIKKGLTIVLLSLAIPSPWFIRNWILLGNPIWPFLNFIFHGYQSNSYSALDLAKLYDYRLIPATYFGIFGVPDGNYNLFSVFNVKYLAVLLPLWIFGTFVFLMPLFVGACRKDKKFLHKKTISLWIFFFVILFFLYVANVGFGVSRIILPAFPALAVFWAFGYEKLLNSKKLKKIFQLVMPLIIFGLVLTLFAKTRFAANSWEIYQKDFEWVKTNTNLDALFIVNGQCVQYNIERASIYYSNENLNKADYVWINQRLWLDKKSILDEPDLNSIKSKNYEMIYSNKETQTEIYKTKQ